MPSGSREALASKMIGEPKGAGTNVKLAIGGLFGTALFFFGAGPFLHFFAVLGLHGLWTTPAPSARVPPRNAHAATNTKTMTCRSARFISTPS